MGLPVRAFVICSVVESEMGHGTETTTHGDNIL